MAKHFELKNCSWSFWISPRINKRIKYEKLVTM